MYGTSKRLVPYLLILTAIIGILAYGCSATSTQQSTATSQPAQSQPGQSSQFGLPPATPPDMQAMLTQVAQQLGISEDKLAAAYQQARDSLMPSMPPINGMPQGQGQQPPNPPGQGQNFNDFQTNLYNKIAEILNIPEDQIAAAFSKFQPQFPGNRGPEPPQ
jgi:hypothetical protein